MHTTLTANSCLLQRGIKMTVYFSAAENGFYDDAFMADYMAAGTWPTDGVEISERWYQHLLDGQTKGRMIVINSYGQPVLTDQPAPSKEALIAAAENLKAKLLKRAGEAIAPLQDAVDLSMANDAETASLQAWKKYRVLLNRTDTTNAPDIEWPVAPD